MEELSTSLAEERQVSATLEERLGEVTTGAEERRDQVLLVQQAPTQVESQDNFTTRSTEEQQKYEKLLEKLNQVNRAFDAETAERARLEQQLCDHQSVTLTEREELEQKLETVSNSLSRKLQQSNEENNLLLLQLQEAQQRLQELPGNHHQVRTFSNTRFCYLMLKNSNFSYNIK